MSSDGWKFTLTPLTKEEEDTIIAVDPKYERGTQGMFHPPGTLLSADKDKVNKMLNFEVHEDDIYVITPPKCGTTWMQEIVWLMNNDVDLERAKEPQFYRVPFIDLGLMMSEKPDATYPEDAPKTEENVSRFIAYSYDFAQKMERPRTLKTHQPLSQMPECLLDKAKVVFVARNIKDMAVSYFHHYCLFKPHLKEKGFKPWASLFRQSLISCSPGLPMMLEAWEKRNHPNMFFTTYEDLKRDFDKEAERLMKFLGVALSKEKMEALKKATTIDAFKSNAAVNKRDEMKLDTDPSRDKKGSFIRKGEVGDWKNYFDEDMNEDWDKWIEGMLEGSDFKMTFEL